MAYSEGKFSQKFVNIGSNVIIILLKILYQF